MSSNYNILRGFCQPLCGYFVGIFVMIFDVFGRGNTQNTHKPTTVF